MASPCLIPLPGGLAVSGVARFAVRLASSLAQRGRPAGLILHAPARDTAALTLPVDPGVRVFDLSDLPPVESSVDAGVFVPRYRDAMEGLAGEGPTVLVLGQHAAPFAVTAELMRSTPDSVRAVGVAHSDNGYDARVLAHYEPMLSGLVGVSDHLVGVLRELTPDRSNAIESIPYGVEIPARPATREPLGGRSLRLLYAGRLEHRQKRVMALPVLSAELTRRGIAHTLSIVGDGPARGELEAACLEHNAVSLHPPAAPEGLDALLDAHDAFVLPSRYEGLSIAVLEALAHGCVPVVAPSRSGTSQAVMPGITGEAAHATPDDEEEAVGIALADAVDALRRRDLGEMAGRCWAHAAERFGIDRHADAWAGLIDRASHDAPRAWPAGRPTAFDAPSASGAVPADAADRLRRVLETIGDEAIAVHGAGAHTKALAAVLARAHVVCITDDDRQRHGESLMGLTIADPSHAAGLGAEHVIISTHLHEEDVWRRRGVYVDQGLTVHRLYA